MKPAAPQAMRRIQGSMDGGPGTREPGRIRFTDMPLRALIMHAYDVQSFQVFGPSWMENLRFDIVAKVPDGATKGDARRMLQNLLAERFNLKLHKESREISIYELTVARGGLKIKEAAQTPTAGEEGSAPARDKDGLLKTPHGQLGIQAVANGLMRLQGDAVTMARLAETLGLPVGRPVIDKTGLTRVYDVRLEFSPEGVGPGPKGPAEAPRDANDSGPTLFTALRAQLGLTLVSRKGPMDVLVVDRVEKTPTGN